MLHRMFLFFRRSTNFLGRMLARHVAHNNTRSVVE